MKIFITVMLSFAIVRYLGLLKKDEKITSTISTLLCISLEVLAIIFVWKL